MIEAIIALGSNLEFKGQSPRQILFLTISKIDKIDGVKVTKVAPFLSNEPVGITDDNAEIVPEFLNTVIEISTTLSPHHLLHKLQDIENDFDRKRHNNSAIKLSRTLDLDIITYGNEIISDAELTIPHPLAKERDFVQIPLANLLSFEQAQSAILNRAPEHQIDPTLDRVHGVLARLGNPQNNRKIVHITGTNGKTSTANATRNLLRNAGLKTGLFTSPHIFNITERIQIQDGVKHNETHITKDTTKPAKFLQENVKLAKNAAEVLLKRDITDAEVELVLSEPIVRGRFEEQNIADTHYIFDVAHNPHGAHTLRSELEQRDFDHIIAVVAQFSDKDSAEYLKILQPVVDNLVITTNSSPRCASTESLAKIATNERYSYIVQNDLKLALKLAEEQAQKWTNEHPKSPNVAVLVTGSVITVADTLTILENVPDFHSAEVTFQSAYAAIAPEIQAYEAQHPELGHLSFFEILVCMMYFEFDAFDVDVAIVEVGMGGSWDATNVMNQTAVSIITPIDIDHTDYLGNTIEAIATEKAGILKPGTPAVVAPQIPAVTEILNAKLKNILY